MYVFWCSCISPACMWHILHSHAHQVSQQVDTNALECHECTCTLLPLNAAERCRRMLWRWKKEDEEKSASGESWALRNKSLDYWPYYLIPVMHVVESWGQCSITANSCKNMDEKMMYYMCDCKNCSMTTVTKWQLKQNAITYVKLEIW